MALYDQINDAQVRSLRKEGYNGQVNEMLMQWMRAEGAVGDDIMQLWRSFFNVKSIPQNPHPERMRGWLITEGFPRPTLADQQLAYWTKRALEP